MSAEVLRKAASLMRERAEAAERADCHGPWVTRGQQVVREETEGPALVMIASEGVPGHPSPAYVASAEHIASWHPAVALAVADWLDSVARADRSEINGADIANALTVARAYLGSES